MKGKKKVAVEKAQMLGVESKGSQADIIENIRQNMKSDENFRKVFKKYCGCSGGCLTGSCPHGVVYLLKVVLRAEGIHDYMDFQ